MVRNWPTDLMIALPVLLALAWLAYDALVVFAFPRWGAPSITRRVQALSRDYPAIPFLSGLVIGLIAGHFWGQF